MRKQRWNSLCGARKGFILSLDIAVGVILVGIMLTFSYYYAGSMREPQFSKLNMIQTSSDILAVLDNLGTLQTLDENIIENQLTQLTPLNYNISLEIHCASSDILIGSLAPEDSFFVVGKRYFITPAEICYARHFTWIK